MHDAADVHVDDRVPLVQRQQFGVAAPNDAGVVEHQVQPSGTRDDVVDGGLHGSRVGDVEARRCRGTRPARLVDGALRRVGVDVGAQHIGTRRDERARTARRRFRSRHR